ncbi:MAG: hypothetical protein WCP10_09200 [Desulfuromonadales bacterium]
MGKARIFFNGVKSGLLTMTNASGAALVSMYDTAVSAAGSAQTLMKAAGRSATTLFRRSQ